jgi:hypothetical protein
VAATLRCSQVDRSSTRRAVGEGTLLDVVDIEADLIPLAVTGWCFGRKK